MKIVEPTPEQKRLLKVDELKTTVTGCLLVFAAFMCLWGAGILFLQIADWLKAGEWTPKTWARGFMWAGWDYPYTERYRGLQKIVDWFMSLPLCTLPPFIGCGILLVWIQYADREDEKTTAARSMDAHWRRQQQMKAEEAKAKENPEASL